MSSLSYESADDFAVTAAILRLSTKYHVQALRDVAVQALSLSWPTTLELWDMRERAAANVGDEYASRPAPPHPL